MYTELLGRSLVLKPSRNPWVTINAESSIYLSLILLAIHTAPGVLPFSLHLVELCFGPYSIVTLGNQLQPRKLLLPTRRHKKYQPPEIIIWVYL